MGQCRDRDRESGIVNYGQLCLTFKSRERERERKRERDIYIPSIQGESALEKGKWIKSQISQYTKKCNPGPRRQ